VAFAPALIVGLVEMFLNVRLDAKAMSLLMVTNAPEVGKEFSSKNTLSLAEGVTEYLTVPPDDVAQ